MQIRLAEGYVSLVSGVNRSVHGYAQQFSGSQHRRASSSSPDRPFAVIGDAKAKQTADVPESPDVGHSESPPLFRMIFPICAKSRCDLQIYQCIFKEYNYRKDNNIQIVAGACVMAKKFKKSIGKKRVEALLDRLVGAEPASALSGGVAAEAANATVGCCAIVVNSSSHLRPTTQAVCDRIEQELNGAGSTQWFPDPCRVW